MKKASDKAINKDEIKAREIAFKWIAQAAIRAGKLDPREKSDREILSRVAAFAKRLPKDFIIRGGIDHRDVLLDKAHEMSLQNKNEISCLLIATWTEHHINGLILLQCENIGFKRDEINNVIREVQIRGKITWLLKLIGLPPIPSNHTKNILNLFEERNKYIHYKWKEFDIDKPDTRDDNSLLMLKRYKGTVRYLKYYYSRNALLGSEKRINKLASKFSNLTTG